MVGFPHSEILGSKLVRSSPRLIAAYYVLHRLHAPRHPLNALKALDRSHYQCPQPASRSCSRNLSSGKNEMPRLSAWRILIGQIKLTRIHVASLLLPGVRVKRCKKPSLYDVERSGRIRLPGKNENSQTCSLCATLSQDRDPLASAKKWWSQTGSNRRPHACKARALPTELWPHF